jgi:hypothetical protein
MDHKTLAIGDNIEFQRREHGRWIPGRITKVIPGGYTVAAEKFYNVAATSIRRRRKKRQEHLRTR